MFYFKDYESMKHSFGLVLDTFEAETEFVEPVHVLYMGCAWINHMPSDNDLHGYLATLVKQHQRKLLDKGIRRLTWIINKEKKKEYPHLFTFRCLHKTPEADTFDSSALLYEEDKNIRHIEPSNAFHMQLERLANFSINFVPSPNRTVHIFAAYPATPITIKKPGQYDGRRFFVRTIVRKLDTISGGPSDKVELDAHPETEFAFVEALNSLELAVGNENGGWKYNCIFLNFLVEVSMDVEYLEAVIRALAKRYREKINRLCVYQVEIGRAVQQECRDRSRMPSSA
eukprot:TRINITY_DN18866_c0_g1_i5.p1 TRINITY_DN18866_c0_g1~~TRINITY_DN18866_c0_g1_i5.p1  ORF type:complete len:285 (-),score=42.70 TRINITY_DN18866_c0_g1_i5:18-872(-)